MRSYLSGRAGCLYRQAAGSWNVLDTLGDVIICNHLSATRRFCHVPEPSMGFHEVPWDSMSFRGIPWSSMRFYDVPVNRSVPTEANRGLTSYSWGQGVGICSQFMKPGSQSEIDRQAVEWYMDWVVEFHRKLAVLMHISGEQPARGPEILSCTRARDIKRPAPQHSAERPLQRVH
jgi:hypothetical protein